MWAGRVQKFTRNRVKSAGLADGSFPQLHFKLLQSRKVAGSQLGEGPSGQLILVFLP